MKKVIISAAVMLAAASLVFTSGQAVEAKSKVKVKKVKVSSVAGSSKVAYVAKGKKIKLDVAVKVKPNKAANRKVSYKSSNSSVVAVNKKGVISGKKTGTAKVTVTSLKNKKKKASIKVKVLKNAVSKVKINQKKASLTEGTTLKLKATVKAKKGSFKNIVWTSSKEKIATVSKKGVVKGLKPGNVKIKAAAADGSGKFAVCNVSVLKKTTDVSNLNFTTYSNKEYTDKIVVSFNQGVALGEGNFEVRDKSRPDGQFIHVMDVGDVYTENQVDYVLSLNNNVYNGDIVQVAVSGIDGNNVISKEFIVNNCIDEYVITGRVGQYISSEEFGGGYKSIALESGSLPAGLMIDQEEGMICGIPAAVADNQKCVFALTSETGKVEKVEVNFLIADSNCIMIENLVEGNRKDKEIAAGYVSKYFYIVGGGGSYTVELTDSCNNMFNVYEDDVNSACIYASELPAGTYYPRVKVTDKANPAIVKEAVFQITVAPSAKRTGTIDRGDVASVYYKNTETGRTYSLETVSSTDGSNTKTYSVSLPVGTYNVYYETVNDNDKVKINYLERNVPVNADGNFAYSLTGALKIDVSLTSSIGFSVDAQYRLYLMNTSGKLIKTTWLYSNYYYGDGDYKVNELKGSFNGVASGNYIIRAYDRNGAFAGEIPLTPLTGDTAQQIALN